MVRIAIVVVEILEMTKLLFCWWMERERFVIMVFLKLQFIKHSLSLQLYTCLVTDSVKLAICFDTMIKKINSEKRLAGV